MGFPRLKRARALALHAWLGACAGEDALSEEPSELSLRLRPNVTDAGLPLPVYEPGSTVVFHDSSAGHFRLHFVRTGVHAVPSRDADASGTPDYVEETALEYERVLAFYREQGFRLPVSDEAVSDGNGGDGRFDVYLMNFPTGADGSYRSELCREPPARGCAGYMLQENDFNGRSYASLQEATRILASHELFHAVQNAYLNEASGVLSEATAAWASERYDARLNDFEAFVPSYLARPERSLLQEPTGPPDGFSYGASLFFRQLEEAYDAALVPRLWEELARGTAAKADWALALARVLSRDYRSALGDAYTRFARWNLYTASRADATRSYREGTRYPLVTERAVTLPFHDDLLRLLPLSAHYFVASSSAERVHVAIAPADLLSEQRVLLARERAGRIADIREASAAQVSSLDGVQTGDRVHVVLVDGRAAGGTLRLKVCLGDESALLPCLPGNVDGGAPLAGQDGGVPSPAGDDVQVADEARADDDVGQPAQPAEDAGTDAARANADTSDEENEGPSEDPEEDAVESDTRTEHEQTTSAVRTSDGGCNLSPRAPGHDPGLWFVLLACLLRRRRPTPQSLPRSIL